MLTLDLDTNSKTPLYLQLYQHIKAEILSGHLKPGEKLPSKRALSAHLKLSVMTVETAYAQLVAEGYLIAKPGSGYYVADVRMDWEPIPQTDAISMQAQPEPPIRYDFKTNSVDTADFPFSVWAKLSREVLSEGSRELLNACHPQGVLFLRQKIADYLKAFRGMQVSPEQIVVGAGSEYLTGLIIQLLGRDNAYGVENPGYSKIYEIFCANTARVFPIPMDVQGANVDAITGFGLRVLHVTPSHHFPLGIVMPIARRMELLQWASAKPERYIIEDDYDSEFRYAGRPIPALQSLDRNETVIYINTFTKSLAPSMRISYLVLPPHLCKRFTAKLGFYSCTVPVFEQLTLAKFMDNAHFETHIARMKRIYKQRQQVMCETIRAGKLRNIVTISGCDAGMHLLLTVHNGMKQNALLTTARQCGVQVYGLSSYYSFPVSDMPDCTVVAGFSGLDETQIRSGIEALEQAWL